MEFLLLKNIFAVRTPGASVVSVVSTVMQQNSQGRLDTMTEAIHKNVSQTCLTVKTRQD